MRLKTFEGSYDFRHSSYQQSNQLLHTDIIIETFNLYTLSQKMKQIELYIMINSQHFDKMTNLYGQQSAKFALKLNIL